MIGDRERSRGNADAIPGFSFFSFFSVGCFAIFVCGASDAGSWTGLELDATGCAIVLLKIKRVGCGGTDELDRR